MLLKIHKHLLSKTENIVFFDIDSTLTSTTEHFTLLEQPSYEARIKSMYQKKWKTISYWDYLELSHASIALFAAFLRQTGAGAVCISSWNTDRYNGLFIKELQEAFETISEFPDDWFLGYVGCTGGDRWSHSIKPFIKETGFTGKFVALDDGGFEYSDKDNVVIVNGQLGFNIIDYKKALSILSIDEKIKLSND